MPVPNDGPVDDRIDPGTLTLVETTVAPNGPTVINLPFDEAPLSVRNGQILNVEEGGRIEQSFSSIDSTINMYGGELGYGAELVDSVFNILDGSVDARFTAYGDSVVNVSGGSFGEQLTIHDGVTFNLTGAEFIVNGVDVTDLVKANEPYRVSRRGITVSGTFLDGTSFSFFLRDTRSVDDTYFSNQATVNLFFAVPEPTSGLLLGILGVGACLRRRR